MPLYTKLFSGRHSQRTICQHVWMLLFGICVFSVSSCTTQEHRPMEHMNPEQSGDSQHMQHMDAASGSSADKQDPLLYSDLQHAATLATEDGIYRVSLFSSEFPLPLQKFHSWTLHVETSEGQPLENGKITVHGGMPEHRHDFPTRVKVTDYLGNGDYKVDGVKFSMPGYWQIRFNIKEQTRRDTVVFEVNL